MVLDTIKRIIASLLARLYRLLLSSRPAAKGGATVVFHPPFTDRAELLHHYYAARYFLDAGSGTSVVFPVAEGLADEARELARAPKPDYLGDCSWSDDLVISFVAVPGDHGLLASLRRYRPRQVLAWIAPGQDLVSRLSAAIGVLVTVDRHSTWGCYNYPDYRYLTLDQGQLEALRSESRRRFLGYLAGLPGHEKAYIFGTGPSICDAFDHDFSDGYRIVCNTAIKNRELMDHIRPHFLVAGDAIYHFGMSRYACQFRRDLAQFLARHNCQFLIPERFYPNFVAHNPELARYTVPVPYTASSINLAMKERFEAQPVHNILNQLLLPLASSLADRVYLLGFDGRKSNDQRFWASLASVNYEDLKGYHEQAHPGFFRGMDYQQYADLQAELAEAIMTVGENMGKRYYCLNESGNPALQKRFAGDAGQDGHAAAAAPLAHKENC